METTFENAVVGDKVWDEHRKEYGLISEITNEEIKVQFPSITISYYLDGTAISKYVRTLYWDKLVIPCRPKRKVKKVIEGWYNIYPDRGLYSLESRADERALPSRLGKAHFIHHEYEVEE